MFSQRCPRVKRCPRRRNMSSLMMDGEIEQSRPVVSMKCWRPRASCTRTGSPMVWCHAKAGASGREWASIRAPVSAMPVTPMDTTLCPWACAQSAAAAATATATSASSSRSAWVPSARCCQGVRADSQCSSEASSPTTSALILVVPTSMPRATFSPMVMAFHPGQRRRGLGQQLLGCGQLMYGDALGEVLPDGKERGVVCHRAGGPEHRRGEPLLPRLPATEEASQECVPCSNRVDEGDVGGAGVQNALAVNEESTIGPEAREHGSGAAITGLFRGGGDVAECAELTAGELGKLVHVGLDEVWPSRQGQLEGFSRDVDDHVDPGRLEGAHHVANERGRSPCRKAAADEHDRCADARADDRLPQPGGLLLGQRGPPVVELGGASGADQGDVRTHISPGVDDHVLSEAGLEHAGHELTRATACWEDRTGGDSGAVQRP